jgi:hypothetical protein
MSSVSPIGRVRSGAQTAGALALLIRDWCEVRQEPGRARPHPGGA